MNQELEWLNVPEGFEFGHIKTDADLEGLLSFNNEIHGPETGAVLHRFIEELPDFRREMNYFIRDLDTGKIVSSMNAIPSVWVYKRVPLKNLELGFVGTQKEYQRMGLFSTLYNYFDHLLITGEYDISSIQGIPFFYRQYGYDFVLPLNRNITLQQSSIPSIQKDSSSASMDVTIRESNEDDIKRLMELYSTATSSLLLFAERDEYLWRAQEKACMSVEKQVDTMVLERNGAIDGYFRIGEHRDVSKEKVDSIIVTESSILSYDSVLRTIQYLKQKALAVDTSIIEVAGDTTSNLGKIAIAYGGILQRGWKYQIRIPDILKFLNRIRPVIEGRLRNTMYDGFTREIGINIYRTCYRFNFIDGRLEPIEDIGMQATDTRHEFRIPPHDFVRMVLGEYSIEELRNQDMDFIILPGKKHFLETLFPKRPSYLYNYQI